MTQTTPQMGTPRFTLQGRIKSATKRNTANGTTWRTLVNTPAPDAYGHPGTYEVRSLSTLGQIGTELQITVELRGYARSYGNKDGEAVNTAEHVLQAV